MVEIIIIIIIVSVQQYDTHTHTATQAYRLYDGKPNKMKEQMKGDGKNVKSKMW